MAKLLAVSIAILAFVSGTQALKRISNEDADYQGLCEGNRANTSVNVLGKDPCDLNSYIMCFGGVARFLRFCPYNTPRFNKEANECQRASEVPLPPNCNNRTPDNRPLTCEDGAKNMANKTTCRWYISCASGVERPMPCQSGNYFIGDQCMPYIQHYGKALDQEKLQHCKDLDKANGYFETKKTPRPLGPIYPTRNPFFNRTPGFNNNNNNNFGN